MGISFLRQFLQALCCNSPWNYAVFWKFKHQNEMVLTWEDCFCDIPKPRDSMVSPVEDLYTKNSNMSLSSTLTPSLLNGTPVNYLVGFSVAEMSRASHVVGKGIIGDTAFKGNARWIYSDSMQTDVLNSIVASEYPDEWLLQFAAGIKTILLLPVIPDGVLQLGSMELVSEDTAVVAYVKNKFEAQKESYGCIQQVPLMSAFMEDLKGPSNVTAETVMEDQNSIDTVRIEDHHLIANQMVPVFMFQDLCNSSERHVTDKLEDASDREIILQPIHACEPSQLSYADHEDEILEFYHEENHRASPHCYELSMRMCGDFVNELLDFQFEEDVTGPIFVCNNFDSAICDGESNVFNFPGACALDRDRGSFVQETYKHISGTSILGRNIFCHSVGDRKPVLGVESAGFPEKVVEEEHLFKTVVANTSNSVDDDASDKSNLTSIDISSRDFSKNYGQPKHSSSVKEDQGLWNSSFGSIVQGLDTTSNLSSSASSTESKITSLSDKQQKRKGHNSLNQGKLSRLTTMSKRRARNGDNQRPRPHDRQLIQDRLKELRELVPNSEKSSIDGLLNKTIKHMRFLRSVTDQADKLRHSILREEFDENTTKPAEINYNHQDGTSWAVELGSKQHFCPIIVKDLDHPGHMLIEVICTEHDRFLEITDVIHRLKLTILKGVMEKKTTDNSSWARFIVKASGSFHRLDIFWPLMQLLQKDPTPISTNT